MCFYGRPRSSSHTVHGYRLDVEFALQYGSSTRFPSEEVPGEGFLRQLRIAQPSSRPVPEGLEEVDPALLHILVDTANYAHTLNSSKVDPLDFSEVGPLLLHRLVEYGPLGGLSRVDPVGNLLHLAAIALLTTLLPEYGNQHTEFDAVADHLRAAILALTTSAAPAPRRRKLLLWAIFVADVSVLFRKEHTWELPLLAETCRLLGLHTWPDVRAVLHQYAWFDTANEKPSAVIWAAINASSTEHSAQGSPESA